MFFGAPVWPIQWNPPYDEPIKRIAAIGFKGVELIGWDTKTLDEYYTDETIEHLKQLMASLNLKLTNFSHSPKYLASADNNLRSDAIESFKKACVVAKKLGSPSITSVSPYPFSTEKEIRYLRYLPESQIWTIENDYNKNWQENYDLFIDVFKECCKFAAEQGLDYLIEPHPYRYVNSAQSMLRMIEKVDEPNLGFNFDPSHLFPSGDLPQWSVYMLNSRVKHTHLSDNDSFTNVHWRPGKGKMDWKAIMQALKDVGYDGALSFELEDVPYAAEFNGTEFSDKEMDTELKLAADYIRAICKEIDIVIE